MTPEEQQLDSQIREGLIGERQSAADTRDGMNRHITDVQIENISQRRELLKHISLISAAILGLMTITADAPIIKSYFIIGAALHMVVIVLILSYLREHIDKDSLGLQINKDKYGEVLEEKIDLVDEYLAKPQLTQLHLSEYFHRLRSSPSAQRLDQESKELKSQRNSRENQTMDYFAEMVVFIFLCASSLVFMAFFGYRLSIWQFVLAIPLFSVVSFSDSSMFLAKWVSIVATRLKLISKKKIELAKIDKETIGDIIQDESSLILNAEKRYGPFFKNAADFNSLLQHFVREIKAEGWIFAAFLSQVRKHHTLALFSAVRRHHLQSQLDLRLVIEAGANAAYAIANPSDTDFVTKDGSGIVDAPQHLTNKRYQWLENNFGQHSSFLKNQKNIINRMAHSDIIYAFLNFDVKSIPRKHFETPFFDKVDDFMIKTDLWFIANLAMGLIDLFLVVNQKYKIITFHDDCVKLLKQFEIDNKKLKEEMERHPRYQNAQLLRTKTGSKNS